ncbi:hypothetical protein NECAME_06795 [Necator americanus]|uniref:Uncharacterized protein n=1 Tax=Necator americanus TaxID=51031 RepID=W2TSJ3_NECAM|nr:hypothetical protein NECAME_06795 [Necator americanus]ETN84634.1 hypothetical protein NECAME_06795 [Necator americanus]
MIFAASSSTKMRSYVCDVGRSVLSRSLRLSLLSFHIKLNIPVVGVSLPTTCAPSVTVTSFNTRRSARSPGCTAADSAEFLPLRRSRTTGGGR